MSSKSKYVKKKPNAHLANFKKNIKAVSNNDYPKKVISAVVKMDTVSKSRSMGTKAKVDLNKEVFIKDYFRFDWVSKTPLFITCNNTSDDIKEECSKETISGIIIENLTYPSEAIAKGIHGEVWVRFVIDKKGYVTDVTAKGPENGLLLEKEAERLVKLLPKFIPGKHNNEYVNVEYFMPIAFHLNKQ